MLLSRALTLISLLLIAVVVGCSSSNQIAIDETLTTPIIVQQETVDDEAQKTLVADTPYAVTATLPVFTPTSEPIDTATPDISAASTTTVTSLLPTSSASTVITESTSITSVNKTPTQEEDQKKVTKSVTRMPDDGLPKHYFGDYTISDTTFGTETIVTVSNGIRTIKTNALPDHETGEFPNSGNPNAISEQSLTYEYTTNPVNTGMIKTVSIPGVAVNGVKFEPGTAETVTCETGEVYRVEGLQDAFDLGMDFNNAHVQPTGAYHYHGLSELLAETHNTSNGQLTHVGFAADGYLIYISAMGEYSPSYQLLTDRRSGSNCLMSLGNRAQSTDIIIEGTAPDGTYTSDWGYVDGLGDLDECNGTIINGQYAYIVTATFPYISRCLKGEFSEILRPIGNAPPSRGNAPPPRRR